MASKKIPSTHLRFSVLRRIFKGIDHYVLTLVDTLFYLFYAFQDNVVKHQKKIEIKRAHKIKRGTGKTEFVNETLANILKQVEEHHKNMPFLVRFIPSVIVGVMIWFMI